MAEVKTGSKTRRAQTSSGVVAVGTTQEVIVAANAGRRSIRLQNDHATRIIYLALSEDGNSPTAVANSGFRLLPAGANFFYEKDYTGAIHGISNTGGDADCLVIEL